MLVELESMKFRNVLSYGAKEVEHKFEQGLTMISGRNGSGKSTVLEVLCYNWYGKPYRKIKLESLVNRENKKGLETETVFLVDKKDRYRIVRGMKPNTLKVFKNDVSFDMLSTSALNQEEINKILGIDYKMFKQIVSLAVTYNKPFLTQEASEKREIIEAIFNIKIFGSMLDVLKKKIAVEKVKYTVSKSSVEMLKETISVMRKNLIDTKKAVEEFESNRKKDIEDIDKRIAEYVKEIADANDGIELNKKKIADTTTAITVLETEVIEKKKALETADWSVDGGAVEAVNKEIAEFDRKIEEINAEEKRLSDEPVDYNADPAYATAFKRETEIIVTEIPAVEKAIAEIVQDKKPEAWAKENEALLAEKNKELILLESENKGIQKQLDYLSANDTCEKCGSQLTAEVKEREDRRLRAVYETNQSRLIPVQKAIDDTRCHLEKVKGLNGQYQSLTVEQNNNALTKKSRVNLLDAQKSSRFTALGSEKNKYILLKTSKEKEIASLKQQRKMQEEQKITAIGEEITRQKMLIDTYNAIIKSFYSVLEKGDNAIMSFEKTRKEIQERKSPFDLDALNKEFRGKVDEWQVLYAENEAMAERLKNYDMTAKLLSDEGIKSFFFKRLTPILNGKINEYLYKFDIPVRVNFNEQMEESIYNIGNEREIVSYYSYSEGEKKSIDTSILMSFIDITKIICNWNCNVLMIDELIDGQVDFPRLEKMISCIHGFSTSGLIPCIYIISHRQIDEVSQYFRRMISVDKVDGFSKVEVKVI